MFACIFFYKDGTFGIVSKKDKKLSVMGECKVGEDVEMPWYDATAKTSLKYKGTIVKLHEQEEILEKYAKKAHTYLKGKYGSTKKLESVPSELFEMDFGVSCGSNKTTEGSDNKRSRKPTDRITESRQQEGELSPKKKKAKKQTETKEQAQKAESNAGEQTKTKKADPSEKQAPKRAKKTDAVEVTAVQMNIEMMDLAKQFTPVKDVEPMGDVPVTIEKEKCNQNINTSLTSTWSLCQKGMSDAESSCLTGDQLTFKQTGHDKIPVPSSEVLNVLKLLGNPEVQSFFQSVYEHFKSSTCSHQQNECYEMPVQQSTFYPDRMSSHFQQNNFPNLNNANHQEAYQPLPNLNNAYHQQSHQPHSQLNLDQHSIQYSNNNLLNSQQQNYNISSHQPPQPQYTSFTSTYQTQQPSYNLHDQSQYTSPQPSSSATSTCTQQHFEHTDSPRSPSPLPSLITSTPTSTNLRRSPRKKINLVDLDNDSFVENPNSASTPTTPTTSTETSQDECMKSVGPRFLLCGPKYPSVTADRAIVKKALELASRAKNPGYTLMMKMLPAVFSMEEMAHSKGQGITNKNGDIRAPLQPEKISAIKDYITAWCKKNAKPQPTDKEMNMAITEKVGYCRRKLKTQN